MADIEFEYKELKIEIRPDRKSYNVSDPLGIFEESNKILFGTSSESIYTDECVKQQIDNYYQNAIKEYTDKMNDAYGQYMYEECADRGYNSSASDRAHQRYRDYSRMVNKLTSIIESEEKQNG